MIQKSVSLKYEPASEPLQGIPRGGAGSAQRLELHGYLAHKKLLSPGTLHQDYAYGSTVAYPAVMLGRLKHHHFLLEERVRHARVQPDHHPKLSGGFG